MVGAVVGFYGDALALVDEERDVDVEAGFHSRWLENVVGGVSFNAFRRFGDGHDHSEW